MAKHKGSSRDELLDLVRSSKTLPLGVSPEQAVSAVMCTLTAHLARGEAVDLLNSLPKDVRALFQICATHRAEHGFKFDADQFFRIVAEHLRISEDQAEDLTRLVLQMIQGRVPEAVFKGVDSQLPKSLKRVWRAA